MTKKISFTVINDLVTDQRVHRSAQTLWEEKYEVTLIGRKLKKSIPVDRDYKTQRLSLIFTRGPLFYLEYNLRLFFLLLFKRIDILVAIDLDTLPANYLISVIRRKPLVYDAHELFTEVPEMVDHKRVKKIWLKIEQWILPKIKHSYTVCDSIADIYNNLYQINMKVIRNVPFIQSINSPVHKHDIIPQKDYIIYQGALNKGRGLELLIESFEYIDDINCVIAGDGDITLQLKELISNKNLENKVILTGRVAPDQLYSLTKNAFLGVSMEENLGLNYYYALPNKLFDYIQARVPVLVSDFPEMGKIVKDYDIGETIKSREPKELAKQIASMLSSPDREKWKRNLETAANELNWEKEKFKLLEVFNNVVIQCLLINPKGFDSAQPDFTT